MCPKHFYRIEIYKLIKKIVCCKRKNKQCPKKEKKSS